ncbi:MAG TPA: hypothetical protein VLW50_22060 [Streptosporangiaceae bacterium]|nr:hypothetical protein [Streptosporangiaceae bacterium]
MTPDYEGTLSFLVSRGIELPDGHEDDPPDSQNGANCRDVPIAAGVDDLFDPPIDGVVAEREQLRGSRLRTPSWQGRGPSACRRHCGGLRGRAGWRGGGRVGGFGYVVGGDRAGQAEALREHGADIVVADLAELTDRP